MCRPHVVCLNDACATSLKDCSEKLSAIGIVLNDEEKETGEVRQAGSGHVCYSAALTVLVPGC